MRRVVVFAGCLMVVVGIGGHRANAACGLVIGMVCPGCTFQIPEHSGCVCGLDGAACNCVNEVGQRQTETMRFCMLNNFLYVENPDGNVVEPQAPQLCSTTYMCLSGGSGLNCADKQGDRCVRTERPPCAWTLIAAGWATVFSATPQICIGGVPQEP
jgi:hypothetical protein